MPKTAFRPELHGFAFVNSWTFTLDERVEMQHALLKQQRAPSHPLAALPNALSILGRRAMVGILKGAEQMLPDSYGLCGGMAFAALDYFTYDQPPPRGRSVHDQPQHDSRAGTALRNYLWRRQLDSLTANGAGYMQWMVMLHTPLPGAGPGWLLSRTRREWQRLKGFIDRGEPCTLGLIGTTTMPFNNHQVLALGYDDQGDGTGTVYLYDMNCPGKEQTIILDFRGKELVAQESCPSRPRGPLRGFFCQVYRPVRPPAAAAAFGGSLSSPTRG